MIVLRTWKEHSGAIQVEYYDGKAWQPLPLDKISQRLAIEQEAVIPLLVEMLGGRRADAAPSKAQTIGDEMDHMAKERRTFI